MRLAQILAVLATAPEHTDFGPDTTLEMLVCLTPDARIDAAATVQAREYCRVRRFRAGVEEWSGILIRLEDGWALRSDRGEDEPLWPIKARALRPGEYLTVCPPDGGELLFRIVNVEA